MDNKTEVLNRLLDEVNRKLQLANGSIEKLKVEREINAQALKKLYDYEDKLEKRRTVLQEIIEDENLKSGVIKENTNDDIIVGVDMGTGPDMAAIVKAGAQITSPLYHGEAIATEMHMIKSSIAQGTAEEIMKQLKKRHKHGKV